jgi:glycosyltransferase involved in cell wall biosynthesis
MTTSDAARAEFRRPPDAHEDAPRSPDGTDTRPTLLHVLVGAEPGGCERNAEMVIRHLPDVSHRILFLARGSPIEAEFRAAGATVDVLPHAAMRTNSALIARVRTYAGEHRPAAVMVWHGVWVPQLLHAFGRLGVPLGVHGGNPFHTLSWWVDWKLVLLGLRYPPRRLPTYVCCSQYVADSLDTSWYHRRFPRAVVPNGAEVPSAAPHEPRLLDPAAPLTIGMLARLDAIKDHDTVLRAFAQVRQTYPHAVLELAGSGDRESAVRALASDLGMADAVRLLGRVTDVYSVMARWDLFAYATTEREGLGNSLLEAMMLGLPCAVTDVGPMREVAGDPPANVLVPARDPVALAAALARLAGDVGLRRHVGTAARSRALAKFRPDVFARRYARILMPALDT